MCIFWVYTDDRSLCEIYVAINGSENYLIEHSCIFWVKNFDAIYFPVGVKFQAHVCFGLTV